MSPRATGRAADRQLLKEGEVEVRVTAPLDQPYPEGFTYGWPSRVLPEGRTGFYPDQAARPRRVVRVAFKVWADTVQLADLRVRADRNRSGEAVRGWATCRAGQEPRLNMNAQRIFALVSHAANSASHRSHEGPVSCQVKLLDQPEPAPATCLHCKRVLAEHDLFERVAQGKWVGGRTRGAHFDADAERVDRYFACPVEVLA